jgi:hypothetical protein
LPDATPSRLPTRTLTPGAGGLVCPGCNGDSFTERSSFKTASEPLLGSASTTVTVDLMSCKRCGADIPAVRGRRSYNLLSDKRLSALLADLEEAQRVNSEMEGLLDALEDRSRRLSAEIERCKEEGVVSVIEAKVAGLEAETEGLEVRRERLARTLELMAARVPA